MTYKFLDAADRRDIIKKVSAGNIWIQYQTYREYLPSNEYDKVLQHIANSREPVHYTLGPAGIEQFKQWCKTR
tara:strand:+ start:2127 stop:2345 length:219 start_codon:yes stop_codon:yes gene_type:complete